MYTIEGHEDANAHWRSHNSKPQCNPEFSTLDLLRNAYPNYHVTETNPEHCDLIGYAEAGHAVATKKEAPYNHIVRSYTAPESRLEKDKGRVSDTNLFVCWSYRWRDTDFLVYQVQYLSRWGTKKLLYVLHRDGPRRLTNAATDALLLESGRWSKELHGEVYVFDNTEWRKSKDLWRSVEGASWDDVILEPGMKQSLIRDVQHFFDTRDIYRAAGVPWKRGVILHGVPGNGKTLSVRALINSLAKREDDPVPALYVKSLDGCAGPKYSIQIIFKKARAVAPCLLVFEDLDSLVGPKTRSYFLNEVDGLESNDGILMIGSTNYLDRLDSAITKRPSRFDRKYHFKLPDEPARLAYAQYWSRKFPSPSPSPSSDLEKEENKTKRNEIVDFPESLCPIIAKITSGFSFAYMKELFIASLLTLARGGSSQEDLLTDFIVPEEPHQQQQQPQQQSERSSTVSEEEPVIVGEDKDEDEKEEEEGGKKKSAPKQGDVSASVSASAAAAAAAAVEATKKPKKTQKTIPWVEIPEELRDSALLRVILTQATILLGEMDNSGDDADGPPPKSCEDASDEPPLFSPAWFAIRAAQMEG